MSDLLAECDWHDSTLFLVLPEDPERIGVRLFPSRHAPSRVYVPEAEIARTKAENAKLREVAGIVAYCMQAERDCDGCKMNGAAGTVTEPAGCDVLLDLLRELGVIA